MATDRNKINAYQGTAPYIHVSFHPDDKDFAFQCLEKLHLRGVRTWFSEGIAPGAETDEIIAQHIIDSDLFIAFISQSYLNSLDHTDELNFSRDENKDYLLIRLDSTPLPAGLDMRFIRSADLNAYSLQFDDLIERIFHIENIDKFYGIADANLKPRADKIFSRLNVLYPEHKIFALDAIDKHLAEQLSKLYIEGGYTNVGELLSDYGYSNISTEEARKIRNSVVYQPGFEPDFIKTRIKNVFDFLSTTYPDKIINQSLTKNHKSVSRTLQGFSIWLGYDKVSEMLAAYGFQYNFEDGRPSLDYEEIINKLRKAYENKPKPSSLTALISENPELKPHLKTLSNTSIELFGETLSKHLYALGIIAFPSKKENVSATAQKRQEIIQNILETYNQPICGVSKETVENILSSFMLKKYVNNEVTVTDCSTVPECLHIPHGINVIGKEVFAGQSEITELYFPSTLTKIKEGAFSNCCNLKKIVFEDGIETIDNLAFAECSALETIVFPKSLKSIENEAFAGCENLANVVFENRRTNIQSDAFDRCIFSLDNLADDDASPAEDFEIVYDKKNNGKIVKYIGKDEIVIIPDNIAGHPIISIEKGCFENNTTVKEILMRSHITSLGKDAFKNCKKLEKLQLSDNIKSLASNMFAGCNCLREINIPDNVTEISRGLFKDSPLLTVYIGKNVSQISPGAFYKGIIDPISGHYIQPHSLNQIIIDLSNEHFISEGTAILSKDRKTFLYEFGNPVSAEIPEGIETIEQSAFENIHSLEQVILPKSLKAIKKKAFSGTGLKSVEFPKDFNEVGEQAFYYCKNLTEVILNEELKTISDQAFAGCPIADVYIPASVEVLGKESFLAISTYQGTTEQKFNIDTANPIFSTDGIALYKKVANEFHLLKAYGKALRSPEEQHIEYTVKDGTTVIETQAFARCKNLYNVTLPENLLAIEDMAFCDCPKLESITIPKSCIDISAVAFFGTNATINKEE